MNKMRNILFAAVALMIVVSCSVKSAGKNDNKKKIVLIPGNDSHGVGEHEHLGGCILLGRLLKENIPGVETVVTEQGWPKDTTVLDDADAIVMYSDGGEAHMVIPHMAHIDRLMKKGVGLVNLHYAVEIPKGEGGGDNFLNWVGGYFESDYSVNPHWVAKFENFPKHPVTNGVKPFEANDEWYYHMRFVDGMKNVTPILTLLPPPSSLERPDGPHEGNPDVRKAVLENKEPQHMAWAYDRPGGGRGFGFTGAHVHQNWKIDDYRKLVLNAIAWTANIVIPEDGIKSATPTTEELVALQKKK
jgi:type 1 glutamine amidotransferase